MKSRFLVLTIGFFSLFGCTKQDTDSRQQSLEQEITLLKKQIEELKPGLGEIMTTIHLHHAKLYYSGKNENWLLASYQLDEIKEGFDGATTLYDHFKNVKGSLKDLRHITDSSMAELEAAIREHSKAHFLESFHKLTSSCNQCHQAAEHGFIVVQTPTAPMFSNQKFEKEKE